VYSFQFRCAPDEAELLSLEVWEAGAIALSDTERDGLCIVTAGFESEACRDSLLDRFVLFQPEWHCDETDWEQVTRKAWPARSVGRHLFLAPPWCTDDTPPSRIRIVHNPGLASGTGEHPCTQLALEALERIVAAGSCVLDVGTGSGLLAIGARKLGATEALGLDSDIESLKTARENFELNALQPTLAAGSADCVADEWANVTVANISGSVLFSIMDDLVRVTRRGGHLILTGFSTTESGAFQDLFPDGSLTTSEGWSCLATKL
jgi:ribosomal protein L11 methyltransferase